MTQVSITPDIDSFSNFQLSSFSAKICVTTENDKSIKTPVIYIITVLNFKSLKICVILSLFSSLKHGSYNMITKIAKRMILKIKIIKY
jgi:hypothetical protein